jgi:hypothetical protein
MVHFVMQVNIGVCANSAADLLDFSTDTYRRLLRRGESTCFECLDQADIVVQSVVNSEAAEGINLYLDFNVGSFSLL